MSKRTIMCVFKVVVSLLLLGGPSPIRAELSDKRLCVDRQCTELIAEGRTLMRFNSMEEGVLSFAANETVRIYSFGAGSRPQLLGVQIGDRQGYVYKHHVQETRRIKKPTLEVDLEPPNVEATASQAPFQVVEGTRIPLDLSTEAPPDALLSEKATLPQPHEDEGAPSGLLEGAFNIIESLNFAAQDTQPLEEQTIPEMPVDAPEEASSGEALNRTEADSGEVPNRIADEPSKAPEDVPQDSSPLDESLEPPNQTPEDASALEAPSKTDQTPSDPSKGPEDVVEAPSSLEEPLDAPNHTEQSENEVSSAVFSVFGASEEAQSQVEEVADEPSGGPEELTEAPRSLEELTEAPSSLEEPLDAPNHTEQSENEVSSGVFSVFGASEEAQSQVEEVADEPSGGPEDVTEAPRAPEEPPEEPEEMLDEAAKGVGGRPLAAPDMFLYLSTTALAVLVLIFVWVLMEKWRRSGPLIGRINHLEQQLLATSKENEVLQAQAQPDPGAEARLAQLELEKRELLGQLQAVEKELDDSTEMGIELNRIIGEMLAATDGSEILRENIEQMRRRLLEQQETIAALQEAQRQQQERAALELDQMAARLQQASERERHLQADLSAQKQSMERDLAAKSQQYEALKATVAALSEGDAPRLDALVQGSESRAHIEQLQSDNRKYAEQLSRERDAHQAGAAQLQAAALQLQELRALYEQTERDRVESCTKLAVLTAYFKEKEERMLKEIGQYESLWSAREGEATTTSERSRHLQEELQNYKAQNDSLKQEIVNQEVALKSQISLLEKQAHERWVSGRQAERKLEEARQEAALLRNRLTLTERSQLRMQSPLLQNGDRTPDAAQSPPPPALMPFHPFMLPPPADMALPPPFMPAMFPGDHRPPPLGRMSSPPPVGRRYSPESTVYSEYERYERRSASPPYDSEYGASPPPMRNYSPYREYRRSNGRHPKVAGADSSGSEGDFLSRKPPRKV